MEITKIPMKEKDKPKVGVYVRVSTKKEEQEYSFVLQSEYWNRRFANEADVEYIGLFSDEGISGKMMRNRKGLNKLLDLARSGGVDLIYTKSISRFARNYTELLAVARELRDMGIPLIFEKENINTLDPKCGLILTVMSSLAEQELISMSKNQQWAARKRFANGSIELTRIYGYAFSRGKFTVIPEEAAVVKEIFGLYLQGNGVEKIAQILTRQGYKTVHGSTTWSRKTVLGMLKNEKYTGNSLLQKSINNLKVKKINKGELPQYYIENSHEAIIPMETFEAVQRMIQEKVARFHPSQLENSRNRYPLSGKIKCGECGATYKRKVCAKGTTYETIKWACGIKDQKGKEFCESHEIKNDVIERLLIEAFNESLDKQFAYSGAESEYTRLRELLATEQELKTLNTKGYISDMQYRTEKEKILNEIKSREATIQALQSKKMANKRFEKSAEFTKDMADFLIQATVKDWTVTFEFMNGVKITKSYTNGRAGNVNGKLCKHKA